MLSSVVFNKGQAGLGQPLAGQDYISGLLFYTGDDNLPSGWNTSNRINCLFSVADAQSNGILVNFNPNNLLADSNYADAIAAQAALDVATIGTTGDVITVTCAVAAQVADANGVASIGPQTVTLCTYTQTAADTANGVDTMAGNIKSAINANTYITGFSAPGLTGSTITIQVPKAQGMYLNTGTPFAVAKTAGSNFTFTLYQPTGSNGTTIGTQSLQAIWYYHISEYFRLQPKGQLYVGFYPANSSHTFTEITTMQNYTQGLTRQIGIYLDGENEVFTPGDLTAIHNEIVANDDNQYQPLSALYAADLSGTADLSTLANLNSYAANKVSAIIGQDGAAQGAFLFTTYGKSITCLGAALGAVAFAAVSDDIGWIQKFNLSNGMELDTPAFANGQLLGSTAQGYWTAIDSLRYIFVLKYVGNAGSFFNDSHCACSINSDYAYIENNRTIDKADRGIYASVLPYLKGPLLLNSDGTLADTTLAYLISLAGVNLAQMVSNSELSGYQVTISSTQNVQSTGNLMMAVQLLGISVARNITVNIGYVFAITGGQ